MKRILTLLFFCFSVVFLSAQFPHWDWARCAKSSISNTIGFEEGTAVSTDPSNGNVIVGGFFYQDTFAFGNITLGNDYQGLFITKYDSSGNVLWAKEAIGDIESANSGLWAIATDLKGNVFITGGFSGPTLQLDSVLLNNPNGFIPNDNVFFLAKYDASGNLLWAISSSAESGGKGVTCDKWGNVYVTGYFAGTFTLGSTTLIDTLWQSDVFIAKFDSLGNAVWAKQAKGAPLSSTNSGIGISSSLTTAQTDLYVTGFFVNTITFDTITLNPSSDSVYNFDFFIAKYDSSGNLLWAKAGLGNLLIYTQLPSPYSYGLPVAEDRFGNAYVAGGFTNKTIVFGRDTLWNSDISGIGINIFVVKFDALGNVTWSKSVKGNCGDRACGITADPWGNFYLAASFYDSISFGSFSLGISDSVFLDPLFMLKADSNGNVIVGTALNSGGDDWIGISADPFGNAYLSSDFFANPFIVGTDTLLLTAGENDFVAKFTSGSLQCNLSVSVRRSGDTLIASNASTYQWYFNGNPIVGDTANHIVTSNAGNYTVLITDINGCTALSSPVAFTSIKPLTDDHIIIYPNPSTGKWQLTTNPEYIGAEMQIFDASGRLVFKSEIKNIQSEINLNVPNGIYFLRLGNSENTVVSKLVKL